MSKVMTQGIIGMPFDLAMSNELSRRQFHGRAQSLLSDYAALEAECKRLLDLLADWSSHFTGPKVIGGPLSSLRERTDAALLNGGRP